MKIVKSGLTAKSSSEVSCGCECDPGSLWFDDAWWGGFLHDSCECACPHDPQDFVFLTGEFWKP
jgi:hypothetical protein